PSPGFRLDRLELLNWGTFNDRVWILSANSRNTLVTGDIGSGKSTIVDAITTLLLPANRISYNKAAGAETRERSLRSYVLGHFKSERNETTGATAPVALRDATKFSVILGVFTNEGYGETVTIAQVFWMPGGDRAGQPARLYVTADGALSINPHFSDFGTEMTQLRKRLRAHPGVLIHDAFPQYGKDFRRRLGIESEQAMELFHQTVSMKSVGNLTQFVREHMLEPFDAAKATRDIVAHFEDLTKAHEAVQRAQAQLGVLTPLIADCDAHDKVAAEIAALTAQREALRYYFADHKLRLVDGLLSKLCTERTRLTVQARQLADRLDGLRVRERSLHIERAGHGGDRLAQIEQRLTDLEKSRAKRAARAVSFAESLTKVGLDPVMTAEHFAVRRGQIAAARGAAQESIAASQNNLTEVAVAKRKLDEEAAEVNAELRSLQARKNNIPARDLEVRERLCRELRLTEESLPFAGELIAVREDEADWEGAAERLLHGFALSVLVPERHYAAVSDWINGHHLSSRIVYYRVPQAAGTTPPPDLYGTTLASRLEVKDSPFASWLDRELAHRADLECVETMAEFRRMPKAITKAGQVKGAGGRHEKDDRFRIDDRRRYVLGWSNERKIDAMIGRATALAALITAADKERVDYDAALQAAIEHGQILAGLDATTEFADIDYESVVNEIADLRQEHDRLTAASAELARLDADLKTVAERITGAEREMAEMNTRLGRTGQSISDAEAEQRSARAILADPACDLARGQFPAIAGLLAEAGHAPPATPGVCGAAETTAERVITGLAEKRADRRGRLATRIVTAMDRFRGQYPMETSELDSAVEAADGYRELHSRLSRDDLPRFRSRFKTYLNKNTIMEIAQFQAQLNRQSDLIRERIDTINRSLVDVDYNRDRYIRLEPELTPNTEIKDFRSDLRACTDNAVSPDPNDDHYSEQKFLQVKRIIERFKGREGQTDTDQKWTKLVTDVRNWFTFSASERWRADDTEYERYADSAGKSGGQKEKLAYTILAASLAYQFKLEWGVAKSRTFRFAVIDEAFGRGSDESTKFALELFGKLGLQLLIVTPLQKIHVIEPFVSSVGFVDNPTSMDSRLRNLTIEEYHQQRLAHALGAQPSVAAAVA
ncbi:MAG: ATP-binding protein, partial [Trebonia sp.]